jgi:hypothetical protein
MDKVLERIQKERRVLSFKKTVLICGAATISSAALVPAFGMLFAEATESGFINLSSTIFSNHSMAMAYWRSFGAALLETLPIVSLAVFLLIAFVFLQSFRSLLKLLNNAKLAKRQLISPGINLVETLKK